MNQRNDLIVALDCSLRWTNVAISSNGDTLVSKQLDIGRRQAAELPLIVEQALQDAQCTFADVGLLAVTNGPGYFTGIRAGVAYAAALAYGLNVKVVPVSTLYMLAYPCILRSLPVFAVVYAGRGHLYAASYGCGEDLAEGEYEGQKLNAWLSRHENVVIVSDDPQKAAETSGLSPSRKIRRILPDASIAAWIAWRSRAAAVSPRKLKVCYYRNPQVN
jgi:tRNA threonylcarbamoyladenosine biosynthesis protein TsaB